MKILLLTLLMPSLVFAYTDAEILTLVSREISVHSETTIKIFSFFSAVSVLILGWMFALVNKNSKNLIEIEKTRHDEHISLLKKMEENCAHVDDKINTQILHVERNYIRYENVEKMLENKFKPLHDQLAQVQATLNSHFNRAKRFEDSA